MNTYKIKIALRDVSSMVWRRLRVTGNTSLANPMESDPFDTGEITITKHGKPILRVLPIHPKQERPLHQDLRQKMPRLKIFSAQHLGEDRDDR